MDRQALFDQTLLRLDQIVTSDFTAYSALESAGLVRKLLIDSDPLYVQVNRDRRLKVLFEVASKPAYEAAVLADRPMFWAPGGAMSPRLTIIPGFTTEALTRDQFLARRAMQVLSRDVSVKEIVLQLANVEGGVHAGLPKTDAEKRLNQVNASVGIGGMGSVANSMQGIADVVVAALRPLSVPAPNSGDYEGGRSPS